VYSVIMEWEFGGALGANNTLGGIFWGFDHSKRSQRLENTQPEQHQMLADAVSSDRSIGSLAGNDSVLEWME
jgi:hypothetical protein